MSGLLCDDEVRHTEDREAERVCRQPFSSIFISNMNETSQQQHQRQPQLWLRQCRKMDGRWIPQEVEGIQISSSSSSSLLHGKEQSTKLYNNSSRQRRQVHSSILYIPFHILSELFLPRDYPHSVHTGYLEYQLYDSIQGLCSYLRGTISTSAILTVAGVGDADATSWGAAMQWALKDGMGMMGGLVFSYYTSSHFDSHVKEFRLFADFVNDVGLFLDMIGPSFLLTSTSPGVKQSTSLLWILSSLATLCRVMCGMAAGATKGSITQHFSKHNLADLNSKEGTQETLISLFGMILGIFLARYLQQVERIHGKGIVQVISWSVFSILTIIHIWANYRAVSILRLRSLNQLRAECAVNPLVRVCTTWIIQQCHLDTPKSTDLWNGFMDYCSSDPKQTPLLLSPDQVFESFLSNMFRSAPICLGSQLHQTFQDVPWATVHHALCHEFRDEKYVVFIHPRSKASQSKPIHVSLRLGATEDDILKALTHALILQSLLACISDFNEKFISCAHQLVNDLFKNGVLSMSKLVELGWESKLYFPSQTTCRVDWGEDPTSMDPLKED